MKRFGVDVHSIVGMGGCFGTVTISQFNQAVGLCIGVATLAYMSFRAMREYRKMRAEGKHGFRPKIQHYRNKDED
jgi:hypothetical protein